jgi:thymidylate synthase (FAD)
MHVKLLWHTPDPLRTLYVAFRTCYSKLPPEEIDERVDRAKVAEFLDRWLAVGHTTPLEHVVFHFAVSGISRSLSHQLVRHRVGISFDQQSQRYVEFSKQFPYVIPDSIQHDEEARKHFERLMEAIQVTYRYLVSLGVPAEDARFVLPNATATNLVMTANLAALKYMAGLRLCTRAQWEFRHFMAKVRAEVVKVEPLFGRLLMPKCFPLQKGACDESLEAYNECPLSKVRPHVSSVL